MSSQNENKWSFKSSLLVREIRRAERNRIILVFAVLLIILYLNTMSTIYKAGFYFSGATQIRPEEISHIDDPEIELTEFGFNANFESSPIFKERPRLKRLMFSKNGSPYVELSGDSLYETGILDSEGSNVVYRFCKLSNGKYIFVKLFSHAEVPYLKGTVGYLPADIRTKALLDTSIDSGDLLPLFFDATESAFYGITSTIAFSVMVLLFWALWAFFVIRRALVIDRSPTYERLYMCHGAVEDNAFLIEKEVLKRGKRIPFGTTLTENWYIKKRLFSFWAEPRTGAGK